MAKGKPRKVRKRKTYTVKWTEPSHGDQSIEVLSARGSPNRQQVGSAIRHSGKPFSGVQVFVYDAASDVVRHFPAGKIPAKE